MWKKEGLCIDLCVCRLISSISNKLLLVEAVLAQLNSAQTYNIVFDSEEE